MWSCRRKPSLFRAVVESVRSLTDDLFLLNLVEFPEEFDPKPGNFLHIRVSPEDYPLLRRPISIQSYVGGIVTLLIRRVGVGTRMLQELCRGDQLDVLGPLGTCFSPIGNRDRVLMVGGGVGVAPLVAACYAKHAEGEVDFCYGVRTAAEVQVFPDFEAQPDRIRFHFSTDDGSMGRRGFCTGLAADLLAENKFTKIFTCGPWPMMAKIAEQARKYDLPLEASLEVQMGCGLGACLSCVYETTGGDFLRSCVEGPVVNGRRVVWE